MNETLVQAEGVVMGDPLSCQSVEDADEVFLVKMELSAPLKVGDEELSEIFLNLGQDARGVHSGERLQVTGVVVLRQMITRSGKIRRGGVYQLLVQDVRR
jgi:hypothetical protein